MPPKKPLAEILAGVYVNELHELNPEEFQHWENSSDSHRRAHLGAMHQVVQTLELFNLIIGIDDAGMLSVTRQSQTFVPTPKKRTVLKHGRQSSTDMAPLALSATEARQSGFTGNMCPECGGMQMVRNGSCEKCNACGATTGCS